MQHDAIASSLDYPKVSAYQVANEIARKERFRRGARGETLFLKGPPRIARYNICHEGATHRVAPTILPCISRIVVGAYSNTPLHISSFFQAALVVDGVNVAEKALVLHERIELRGSEMFCTFRISQEVIAKRLAFCPGLHCIALNNGVGVFTGEPFIDEFEKDALGEEEALSDLEVLAHALGVDRQVGEDKEELVEHIVEQYGTVGQDDAFDRRVADVALVPECDIFECSHEVRAHHACQAAELFAEHGIALVRHCGRAFLALAKRFFEFADFRALEVADFKRDFLNSCAGNSHGTEIFAVAVALDNLRGDRSRPQTKPLAHVTFDFHSRMCVVANRPRNFPHAYRLFCLAQPRGIAFHLFMPEQAFQAERDRFRVHAVRATHHDGVFVRAGHGLELRTERLDVSNQAICRAHHAHALGGINNVRRCEAEVDVARLRADVLSQVGGESHHVVAKRLLELFDAFDAEFCPAPNGLKGVAGHFSLLGPCLADQQLDLEPDFEFRLIAPEGVHFG